MKFSVIVPVYNAEQYLDKCISSIVFQTYENWEMILVDDGSTDSSARIIDNYALKDSRIKVFHQKNAGPGIARNTGIGLASGDFIIYLDSDDFVDRDYLTLLLPLAEKHDVVFIDVLQISSDGKVLSKELMSKYEKLSKEQILRSQMTGKIPWGGVRKAVRKSIIVDNDIRYTEHKIGEEALYSFRVVYAANSIGFLNDRAVYYYVNHEGSQSKTVMEDPWGGVVDSIAEFLKKENLYDKYADTINAFSLTAIVVAIDRINYLYDGISRKEHISLRMSEFRNRFEYDASIDKPSMSIKSAIFVPFLIKNHVWPVLIVSSIRKFLRK